MIENGTEKGTGIVTVTGVANRTRGKVLAPAARESAKGPTSADTAAVGRAPAARARSPTINVIKETIEVEVSITDRRETSANSSSSRANSEEAAAETLTATLAV